MFGRKKKQTLLERLNEQRDRTRTPEEIKVAEQARQQLLKRLDQASSGKKREKKKDPEEKKKEDDNADAEKKKDSDKEIRSESDSFNMYLDISDKTKYRLAIVTITILIDLLRNHRKANKNGPNLLKYFGLDEANLTEILTAILKLTNPKIDDIRILISAGESPDELIFEDILRLRKNQTYTEKDIEAELEKLTDAVKHFEGFLAFIHEKNEEILTITAEIFEAENRPSDRAQILIADEMKVEDHTNDIQLYDLPILQRLQQGGVQPQPAPAPAQPQPAPDPMNTPEAQEAFMYLDELFRIFKEEDDSPELESMALEIDALFADDVSLGIDLIVIKGDADIADIRQVIKESFKLDDDEINQKAIEIYQELKDKFDLNALFPQA